MRLRIPPTCKLPVKGDPMKRLHVHVAVEDLPQSVRFYSTLFGSAPTVSKPDYAKWMLDDPRVNFAISAQGDQTGLDHLGIQVETPDELQDVYSRLRQAERPVLEEGSTTCCYAKSEKSWISDPQGLLWEAFLTTGESTVYGDSVALRELRTAGHLSVPEAAVCCGSKPLAAETGCCPATGASK